MRQYVSPDWGKDGRSGARDHQAGDALDRDAMQRIRVNDQSALAELMNRHWSPLVRYAMTLIADKDMGEDLVQESFVRLWERRATWKPTGPVRSYLFRIVRNLALQEQEKRSVRRRWRESRAQEVHVGGADAEDVEAARVLQSALERALENLPPRRREIVILARFHDLTYVEIAEIMGISTQTVANQMSSALTELRKALVAYRME